MARRSSFAGVNRLRRTLRRIDPDARRLVQKAVADGAEAIRQDARALVPRDTGDLARGIDVALGRDGLTAQIGISPGGGKKRRAARADLFYARFIEFGTKGGNGQPARPARPFMGPAFDLNRTYVLDRMAEAIGKALRIASKG